MTLTITQPTPTTRYRVTTAKRFRTGGNFTVVKITRWVEQSGALIRHCVEPIECHAGREAAARQCKGLNAGAMNQ